MAISRHLPKDRSAQVQVADDGTRRRSKCSLIIGQFSYPHLAGVESFHIHADWARHADGIRHLDLDPVGQPAARYAWPQRQAYAAVRFHFVGSLQLKQPPPLTTPCRVGIHNDLASGYSESPHRAADEEPAGRLTRSAVFSSSYFRWNDRTDHISIISSWICAG